MSRNPKYNELINSWAWQKLRARKLEASPLCEECERHGRIRAASEVHHITPVESVLDGQGMKALAYDWKNLMSVCKDCHKEIHERMPRRPRRRAKGMTKNQRKLNMANRAEAFASRFLPPINQESNETNRENEEVV